MARRENVGTWTWNIHRSIAQLLEATRNRLFIVEKVRLWPRKVYLARYRFKQF